MKHIVCTRKPLGNPRFAWKQKEFALSTFNCIGEDTERTVRELKEAGFNLLEVGWGSHEKVWEAVDACEKVGIDLLFQDLSVMGGMMGKHMHRPVDYDEIRRIASILKEKKHTVGYYVWDEPYRDDLFAQARKESDLLLECDPEALLFSVFPPSYNPGPTWDNGQYAQAFAEYVKQVDPPVLSMDYYPIGDYFKLYPGLVYDDQVQLDNSPMWLDLTLLRNLAREHNLPFWFYYQNSKVYETEHLEFSMVRMMMYAGVLYGAKGLQSYTATGLCFLPQPGESWPYDCVVVNGAGGKGEFYDDQTEIHKEFKALGPTLLALENTGVYHSSDLQVFGKYGEIYKDYQENIADSAVLAGALPNRCSVGEFTDPMGNRYLMVLNRDFYAPLKAQLPLKGDFRVYEVSRQDGKQRVIMESGDSLSISLNAGDAVLLRLQNPQEEAFTIEYIAP